MTRFQILACAAVAISTSVSAQNAPQTISRAAFNAKLASVDISAARALPNVTVVRDGDFIGVTAPTSHAAQAALASATLPLVGRIAAGRPVETLENPETISLSDITRSRDVFVLEVRGDSMQDEHILDGDYVMVERVRSARNGEIVVALVENTETTLKRFYKEGDSIRLQPANSKMAPIIVPAASVQVQGRVVGVLRKY